MKLLIILLGLSFFFLIVIGLIRPELFFKIPIQSTELWSLAGTMFSFLGFVFSVFAVFEVRSLSQRYFAKQRLPELKAELKKITDTMTSLSDRKLNEIRTEPLLGKISVVLRQIDKTKAPGFSEICKRAKIEHGLLLVKVKNENNLDMLASDFSEFWNLFSTLSEVADEIEAHRKEVQASL